MVRVTSDPMQRCLFCKLTLGEQVSFYLFENIADHLDQVNDIKTL